MTIEHVEIAGNAAPHGVAADAMDAKGLDSPPDLHARTIDMDGDADDCLGRRLAISASPAGLRSSEPGFQFAELPSASFSLRPVGLADGERLVREAPFEPHATVGCRFERRDRGKELPRVGVTWRVENRVTVAFLHDAAVLHDDHAVGDLLDHSEVVADEETRKAVALLQPGEKVEHLRAHGRVEGRHRLVGDDKGGPTDDGARDCHALALAA